MIYIIDTYMIDIDFDIGRIYWDRIDLLGLFEIGLIMIGMIIR